MFIVTADMGRLINSNIRGDGWCQFHCAPLRCLYHFILHEYRIPVSLWSRHQCQTHSKLGAEIRTQFRIPGWYCIGDGDQTDEVLWLLTYCYDQARLHQASPSDRNCIGSVWFRVHLIFHSNFIKSQDWAERRPAASGASQNWNLKLTRFIEMETSNIREFSLNFIDKLRLFWSVSKVSVLLRAFAVQIGISSDCTKRIYFQSLKWKCCK